LAQASQGVGGMRMLLHVFACLSCVARESRWQHVKSARPPLPEAVDAPCRRAFLSYSLSAALAAPLVAAAPRPAVAKKAAAAAAAGTSGSGSSVAGTSASIEFVSGLIAGAAQKTVKELALHPFDTVKTRLQVAGGSRSLFEAGLYDNVYSGIGPAVLSGAPAASIFFAVKDATKEVLTKQLGGTFGNIAAVGAANVPYWLLRNPTEVIKSRRQVGQVEDAKAATSKLWQEQGASGFYRGYVSNFAYAFPVDATKFVIYDAIKSELKSRNGGKKLSPLESAAFGALSAAIAQGVSTPLDVARTKIMLAPADQEAANVLSVLADVAANEGVSGLYAGVSPKVVRAVASGALQFSVLEGVKDAVNDALLAALAPKPR